MEAYNLDFCFKGNRTYVHGTDIYNAMFDYLQSIKSEVSMIDLSFHGIAKKNIEISKEKPEDEGLLKFAYKYKVLTIDAIVDYINNKLA